MLVYQRLHYMHTLITIDDDQDQRSHINLDDVRWVNHNKLFKEPYLW